MQWLYDKDGKAELFHYNDRFVSKDGKNLAWLYNGNVYHINSGKHLGWYEQGILYDSSNSVIAFTRNCEGYLPYKPAMGALPATPALPAIPAKPGYGGIPGRPGYGGWSTKKIYDYFK